MDSHETSRNVKDSIPSEWTREANVIFALANSDRYRNFLERFLVRAGRIFRLPWWVVHALLYLLTAVAFVWWIDLPRLYPHLPYIAFSLEQIGEFTFTTFMIYHLRESRTVAVLAAARIPRWTDRSTWLRRYLAPTSWGWTIHQRKSAWAVRGWVVIAFLLLVYYGGQFLSYRTHAPWIPHPHNSWASLYPYPQLLYLYPTIAKAAMMVAGAAQLWWLYGLIQVSRGKYPSGLTSKQREDLSVQCGRAATRLSLGVSVATAIWVAGRTLATGFTFWAYLYSVWLLLLFAFQAAIIGGVFPIARFNGRFLRELIASNFRISWEATRARRVATLSAVWALALCVGPVAQLTAFLAKP